MKRLAVGIILMLIMAGAGIFAVRWHFNGSASPIFQTVEIRKSGLLATIKYTGTVEPEEVVDIGAQVAGQIVSFGKDMNGKTIYYGSVVDENTVLAQIDDSLYASDVAIAVAQLEAAKAGGLRADADLIQTKAKLDQASREWERAQKIGASEALSQISYDAYKAAFEIAKANVSVAKAALTQANAAINQATVTLDRAKRNLGYCTIKSPVRGIIIDRRVNIGQTVVSSLNAPSLFLIAKDLTRMRLWVPVNEVDIGSIYLGQPVTFTVDAYSGQVFEGQVGNIRLNATMTQNVVTYTVEVLTDNSNGKLLPYLTANVQFELGHRDNVWIVPKSAFRWWPQPEQVEREFLTKLGSLKDGDRDTNEDHKLGDPNSHLRYGIIWIEAGGFVRPIEVEVGISGETPDGPMTEVNGADLREGLNVVVGQQRTQTGHEGVKNPFAVQLPSKDGRRAASRPSK